MSCLENYGYNHKSHNEMVDTLYRYKQRIHDLTEEELATADRVAREFWFCCINWFGDDNSYYIDLFAAERERRNGVELVSLRE